MYLIQQITDSPYQQQSLVLYNGNVLTMTLYFSAQQQGWFIENLTYQDFIINGMRITVNPNFLNQFRNQIPFGLGCYTTLLREPSLLQDFSSNNFSLYILDNIEVDSYVNILSKKAP
jgi:hypothetical protein